jgi:hypothetical protein
MSKILVNTKLADDWGVFDDCEAERGEEWNARFQEKVTQLTPAYRFLFDQMAVAAYGFNGHSPDEPRFMVLLEQLVDVVTRFEALDPALEPPNPLDAYLANQG